MHADKPKVLIAEDNPGLARVLTFKFQSCGFEPITRSNGGDAWKAFLDPPMAAVVSDHEMPIMSGLELIERVRQTHRQTPCFLVTGRQLELSRDPRVAQLEIAQVFGKPFSPGAVVDAVGAALAQGGNVASIVAHLSAGSSSATVESTTAGATMPGAER